jgi:hypothetical protein
MTELTGPPQGLQDILDDVSLDRSRSIYRESNECDSRCAHRLKDGRSDLTCQPALQVCGGHSGQVSDLWT